SLVACPVIAADEVARCVGDVHPIVGIRGKGNGMRLPYASALRVNNGWLANHAGSGIAIAGHRQINIGSWRSAIEDVRTDVAARNAPGLIGLNKALVLVAHINNLAAYLLEGSHITSRAGKQILTTAIGGIGQAQ